MAPLLDPAVLAGLDLFRDLDREALTRVVQLGRGRALAKGTVVFRQDDPADTLYVLVHGRLKVSQTTPEGQQVVVRFIGPHEMFGCVAVLGRSTYPGTATAVVDSVAIGWNASTMATLMARYPAIAMNALGTVGGRLQETQSRLREMSTEKVERRVARALLRLARQSGRRVEDGVEIAFPISRQDIAQMTGATLHTASRILSGWEQQGVVDGGRQRIVIRQPHRLVAIAEDLPD